MDELVHKGHRQRMRRKLSEFGARVFDTYELLEMLLYYTVPVRDTNPLAKKLLIEFETLDGVLSASKEDLLKVDGIGNKTAEFLVASGKALEFFMSVTEKREDVMQFENYDFLGRYVVQRLSKLTDYAQILISFDNEMRLLGVDEIYNFDYSSGKVKSDRFIDAALKRGATVAIIAHNHPYGPLCPTEGDRATNNMIQAALGKVGVFLVEHYVVCGDRYVGFMNHLEQMFAQKPRISEFLHSKRELENAYSR